MWCELWLPPDSPLTIQWHQANVSRAVRKPHDGDDCWKNRDGGRGDCRIKEGKMRGRSLGALFCDVVSLIVFSHSQTVCLSSALSVTSLIYYTSVCSTI